MFLATVEKLPTYGLLTFNARRGNNESVILAAGVLGLYLLRDDPERSLILFISHARVKKLTAFSESLCIFVRDENNDEATEEKMAFVTLEGHEIANLIWELGCRAEHV